MFPVLLQLLPFSCAWTWRPRALGYPSPGLFARGPAVDTGFIGLPILVLAGQAARLLPNRYI